MKIRTSFLPIRLVIGQERPVTLTVEVKNTEEEPRNFSVNVSLPKKLGFDRAGLTTEARQRLGTIEPGEWGSASFKIYSKFGIKEGIYDIDVYVREHPIGRFDKDLAVGKTRASLRVISG